jgi:hypothetical protein
MGSTSMTNAHSIPDSSSMSERIAPTVPKNDTEGRSGLVVSCPDHALPFGIIFEEYAARRRKDLEVAARQVFCCVLLERAFPELQDWMTERHEKYLRRLEEGPNPEPLPDLKSELQRIIHPEKPDDLSTEKITKIETLLGLKDAEYRADVEQRRGPDTWRHPNDQFTTFAEQVCGDLLPHPLEKLTAWLAERDARYEDLERKKQDPKTPPNEIDKLERHCFKLDRPLKRLLHKMNGSAVCLSGGGIRSASFGLGILEGLARFSLGELPKARQIPDQPDSGTVGLLHSIDYLSTVSGGGYIGCWLTSWMYRRRSADQNEIENATAELNESQKNLTSASADTSASNPAKLKEAQSAYEAAKARVDRAHEPSWKHSYKQVVRALAGDTNLTSGDPEPQPIRHVRQYTSYLAPAMGLSLDSWDLAAIVSRNMLINWLMLAPVLFALVALPQISYYVTRYWALYLQGWGAWATIGVILILFTVAAIFAGERMPSHRLPTDRGPDLQAVILGFTMPVLLANWLLAELWYADRNTGTNTLSVFYICVFAVSCVGFCLSATYLFRKYRDRVMKSSQGQSEGGRLGRTRAAMYGAALMSAFVTTLLLATLSNSILPRLAKTQGTKISFGGLVDFLLELAKRQDLLTLVRSNPAQFEFPADERLYAILAFPLVGIVLLISYSFFSGLLGVFELEEDREWMSRAGGLQLAIIVAWIATHALTLYATNVITAIKLGVGGAVLGGIGSALGWSGSTSAGPRPVKVSQLGKIGSFLTKHDLLLPSLCAVALLLIIVGVAGLEHNVATRINQSFYYHFEPPLCVGGLSEAIAIAKLSQLSYLFGHLIVFLCCFLAAVIVNWAININLFSLHGMYRMRLMRAFLGASNVQQAPDLFTQFDPKDTPREIDLAAGEGAPLHVINTTLNLVGTKNLAWRQRKAASFTFTPLHSGCWRLAYVPTQMYAGIDGVSVATAMAISGAAFNPNMGYHSSPLVTLLMTFFNVRLGWWLPNPVREGGAHHALQSTKGADFLHKTGPTIALEPLILEALGMTDETYRWIELTDGGHFENLGLYEMVLRRCRNVIVVDAGADPDCQFEDLGNALRKIEIDLGIPIRFEQGIRMEKGAKSTNRYCAVAKIDYGCVDDSKKLPPAERNNLPGKLVYIKAALTGSEPPDIAQYAATHPTFPHETTANQFFNESQFESYRHLGSYEIESIVTKSASQDTSAATAAELRVQSQLVERHPGSYGIETIIMKRPPAAVLEAGTDFESFVRSAESYVAVASEA